MRSLLRHRPSPAMVVALIALFVALGGGAYAAIKLPANSVGRKQLKENAVTKPKIASEAVDGSKVAADSLTGANILESSLGKVPSAAEADHATSADGATNATNATHAANSDLLAGLAPSAFYATGSTVADSDKLGGIAASEFLHGSGTVKSFNYTSAPGGDNQDHLLFTLNGLRLYDAANGYLKAYTSVSHSAIRAFGLNTSDAVDNMSANTAHYIFPSSGLTFIGTIVYSTPSGSSVVVNVSATYENLYGNGAVVSATGFAVSSG